MASIPRRHVLTGALLGWLGVTAHAQAAWPPVPALSAHRGASALHPEMTAPAFAQALRDGADLLELDVVLSQDGVPVVRHDAALAATEVTGGPPFATTDVATRPEFAQRKTTKTVDGKPQTGWFAEDFTLQELKTLRTRERFPELRRASAAQDGQHPLLTLQEVADLVKAHSAQTGRTVGLLIELKHAAYLQAQGLDLGRAVLQFLQRNQWNSPLAPVIVQSFEVQVLKTLRANSPVRIFQLLGGRGGPPDLDAQGVTYAHMASAQGMTEIAAYAQGAALPRPLALTTRAGRWSGASAATRAAKAAGLQVYVWTLRPENHFLPAGYRSGTEPAARGDALAEARDILATNMVDGLIADDPGVLRGAWGR